MRFLRTLMITLMLAVVCPFVAQAQGDGSSFGLQAPPAWSSDPTETSIEVNVNVWYEENGNVVAQDIFFGPLEPGALIRLEAFYFVGSGRTITVAGYVERVPRFSADGIDSRITVAPLSYTFPLAPAPLVPPVFISP
jgi:hypothetical protein